ncbi:MAG: hypothetical protein ACRC7N_09995 [Clostridium sp.]
MVSIVTFVLLLISFFGTNIFLEKKFKKNPPTYGLKRVLAISVISEVILLTLAVLIPFCFYLLIYGSVIMGCFITIYYRYKPSIVMEG